MQPIDESDHVNRKIMLIFGATSDIAMATFERFVSQNFCFILVGRHIPAKLRSHDRVLAFYEKDNWTKFQNIEEIIESVITNYSFSHVLIAQGRMGLPPLNASDVAEIFNVNVSVTACILNCFQNEKVTFVRKILVLGSIAGDRGKRKNPVYDSSKGALNQLCQGYQPIFREMNCDLILIKVGNARTKMTRHKTYNFLWSTPKIIAEGIYIASTRNRKVIYVPKYWGWIMLVIRLLPTWLFEALRLDRVN